MRVTKIIREYVEKTIKEKMPFGEPTTTYKQHAKALGEYATHKLSLGSHVQKKREEHVAIAHAPLATEV